MKRTIKNIVLISILSISSKAYTMDSKEFELYLNIDLSLPLLLEEPQGTEADCQKAVDIFQKYILNKTLYEKLVIEQKLQSFLPQEKILEKLAYLIASKNSTSQDSNSSQCQQRSLLERLLQSLLLTLIQIPASGIEIKQLEKSADYSFLTHVINLFSMLQNNIPEENLSQVNKLLLSLRFKVANRDRKPVAKLALKIPARKPLPVDQWTSLKMPHFDDSLYTDEISKELIDTTILTEDYLKFCKEKAVLLEQKLVLELSGNEAQREFEGAQLAEAQMSPIIENYPEDKGSLIKDILINTIKMLSSRKAEKEEEVRSKEQQRQILEQKSQHTQQTIAKIQQMIIDRVDSTAQGLQLIAGEKKRLIEDDHDLLIEEKKIQKHRQEITARLDLLEKQEQQLKSKRESHRKAKRALATIHFEGAVKEGKLFNKDKAL